MSFRYGSRKRRVGTRRYWCGREDSNLHEFPHWNLNPARLPVPPLSRQGCGSPSKNGKHSPAATTIRGSIQDGAPRNSNRAAVFKAADSGIWGDTKLMGIEDGGPCRTRTYNQLIKSQLLYQIELTAQKRVRMEPETVPKCKPGNLGWTMGLEPTTTGTTIRGSTI